MSGFKNELAAYRNAIAQGPDHHRRLILQILDRWHEFSTAESMWQTIENASIANDTMPVPAKAFVAWIIKSRLEADRQSRVVREWPDLEAKLRSQAERDWREDRAFEAGLKKSAATAFGVEKAQLLGRKQKDAPRKRFMALCGEAFATNCGKPSDAVVAALTEIAFGAEVTLDSVRGARKPTRQQDRDIRRKK